MMISILKKEVKELQMFRERNFGFIKPIGSDLNAKINERKYLHFIPDKSSQRALSRSLSRI